MAITEWSVQNFRGTSGLQGITTDLAPELFIITGDEIPTLPEFMFNNILVIRNLSSELDGVIIHCGTGQSPREANFTIRIYCMCQINYTGLICMVRTV